MNQHLQTNNTLLFFVPSRQRREASLAWAHAVCRRCLVLALWFGCASFSVLASAEETAIPVPEDSPLDEAKDSDLGVPMVDEVVTAEAEIVRITMGLYAVVNSIEADEESLNCVPMARAITRYLDEEEPALIDAVADIAERAPQMTEEELAQLAQMFQENIGDTPEARAAQERLHPCLRSLKNQDRRRSLDKVMGRFYALHTPMMLAIVGNVD